MEFRILGRLEVWDGDKAIALGGPKPRALLALLLLHANEVVPADRLIEELWKSDGSCRRGGLSAAFQDLAGTSRGRHSVGTAITRSTTMRLAGRDRVPVTRRTVNSAGVMSP